MDTDSPAGNMDLPTSLETLIVAPTRDLGDGFTVRRALPTAKRRMVGPFVFLDQMGVVTLPPGKGLDVRPHPHIGLATVTYLFEGEILHRDSLGSVQPIRPGELNWMTAGRGIVHSERSGPEVRARGGRLFGLQTWVALPKEREETDPTFVHHGAAALPIIEGEGARLCVILGSVHGATSPVKTLSEMFYADVTLQAGAQLPVAADYDERALYVVTGSITIDGHSFEPGQLLVLRPGAQVIVSATGSSETRFMLLGGETMDGPRHVWWNFVSSSKDRIEAAKADWRAGRFAAVPDETEFIPLPEPSPPPVNYP